MNDGAMMLKQILFLLTGLVTLNGCSSGITPKIYSLCLRDDIGNYVIKWEIDPEMEGTMTLFVSDNPDNFNMSSPCAYADIKEGVVTYITNDNISRKYFLLSFNEKFKQIVGARSVPMDSIQNFRDIGGYQSSDNKSVRWGKVFRSGELCALSDLDTIRLNNLDIKTIIDLRGEDEITCAPNKYKKANIISIPISRHGMDAVVERLEEDQMRKGDALLYMQDTYLHFINEDREQFSKALKIFLDKDNYPIVINCSVGKDRTGFLIAMLLAALDVPEETIRKDYMASNDYTNISQLAFMIRDMSTNSQEAITALVTANESFLDIVYRTIGKEYGSMDKFLSKGLHLSEKERDTLKDILLN